jgi:hypothetical protein
MNCDDCGRSWGLSAAAGDAPTARSVQHHRPSRSSPAPSHVAAQHSRTETPMIYRLRRLAIILQRAFYLKGNVYLSISDIASEHFQLDNFDRMRNMSRLALVVARAGTFLALRDDDHVLIGTSRSGRVLIHHTVPSYLTVRPRIGRPDAPQYRDDWFAARR